MGACSSKPKTTEFEGSMNIYLQEESARKNLEDEQKGGCNAGLKSIDPQHKISSKCSLQNLQPAMENEHGSMGDVLLESEKERLAGSSGDSNEKETCARAEGTCDAKHHFVAEEESRVPEIGTNTSRLQNTRLPVGQELYEERAFAQKEDVSRSRRNSNFLKELVVELSQKMAFRGIENGKFQTLENINEDKELPMLLKVGKPRIDAEEGNPVSCRALQEPVFLASRVANANSKRKMNPAGNLSNSGTEKTAACSANGTILLHNGKCGDVILEKPSEPEGLEDGAQRHDLDEALKEQSAPLIVSKTRDSERTNFNFMVAMSNGSLAVKENDVSYVIPPALIGLPKGSALSNGSLRGVEIKVDESACLGISRSAPKSNGKGEDKQVKEAHIATSMINELPCHLSNSTELHAKHSVSADENLGVHDIENPLIVLVNTRDEDDSMAWKLGHEASYMIPGEDVTQVGLKKGRKKPLSVAGTSESIITEALDSQTSSQGASCSIEGEEYASKKEHDLIFCPDEIKVFEVVEMSKEQVIDYERHSPAFQPPQTFKELQVVEPPRSIYGKDMASDIDEVLEKLASEFQRQESLSSFLP